LPDVQDGCGNGKKRWRGHQEERLPAKYDLRPFSPSFSGIEGTCFFR
jgi:hypothetical protein